MSRFILAVFYLFLLHPVNAQQFLTLSDAGQDNTDFNLISECQADYLNTLYVKKVDIAEELINGREYIPYYFKYKVKPLLFDESKHTGSVMFNGRKYNNLKLEYDTYLDQVIYSDSSKFIEDKLFKIALNKDLVDGFCLYFGSDSRIFRNFRTDDGAKNNLPQGFYEVVYDGGSKFIIRHQSFLMEKEGEYEYSYTPTDYVMVGESFFKVRSSGGFIKLFGNDSDAVRKFMQTNKIHFKSAEKTQISTVLRYYDTLVMSKK
jgi:hypothetical protein